MVMSDLPQVMLNDRPLPAFGHPPRRGERLGEGSLVPLPALGAKAAAIIVPHPGSVYFAVREVASANAG